MAPPEPAIAGSSQPLQDIFIKGISDVRSLVTCKICTRYMYEPFTTKCGHTFCYACLSKWLGHGQRKRQCPDCRTKIKEEPCPNYTIRDIVNLLISNAAFLDDDDTMEELRTEQRQEAENLEKDRTGLNTTGLFQGLFKITYRDPIEDAADGVMRCPHCAWEVEDFYCERCDLDFGVDGDLWAEFSDDGFEPEFDDLSLDGHLYDDYESEEPDEEDEAFIDDGEAEVGSIEGEITPLGNVDVGISDHETNIGEGYSSDVDSSLIRRRLRGLDSSSVEDDADGTSVDNDNSSLGSANTLTEGDEDSDLDSDLDSDSSEDDSEDDDEDDDDDTESSTTDSDDEPVIRLPGSQRRSRIPFRQAGSRQRADTRRPNTSVIDLTTPPNQSTHSTRRRRLESPTTGASGTTIDPVAPGTSRNGTSNQAPEVDADNESDSDVPVSVPVRRRKREHIVLSDDDDEPADIQRDSRSQRRRLNQQLPAPAEFARNRPSLLAHAQSCRAN